MNTYIKYLRSTLKHKWYLLLAGLRIGSIPLWRLIVHDLSKFSRVEFPQYACWYMGKGGNKDEWASAWRHHFHSNKHHPEYWVIVWRGPRDFYDGMSEHIADNVAVLPMPETYIREMIAASMTYTGKSGCGRTCQRLSFTARRASGLLSLLLNAGAWDISNFSM